MYILINTAYHLHTSLRDEARLMDPKFQALILTFVIISIPASTGVSDESHVYMTNLLDKEAVIDIHCVHNGDNDMGHQQIPFAWRCQWWFPVIFPGTLQCQANMAGARQVDFLAFNLSNQDPYEGGVYWNFTRNGVFRLVNGSYKLQYHWPH